MTALAPRHDDPTAAARTRLLRRALWATAVMNAGAAAVFAFPASVLGQLGGLPADAPAVYRALVALFVLLFGGVYAWLARRPSIDRPLLALGAIGKAAAFAAVVALWLADAVPTRSVLLFSADLGFAAFFASWLVRSRSEARVG